MEQEIDRSRAFAKDVRRIVVKVFNSAHIFGRRIVFGRLIV